MEKGMENGMETLTDFLESHFLGGVLLPPRKLSVSPFCFLFHFPVCFPDQFTV